MHDKIVDVLSDAIQDFSQVWDSHEAAENGKSMYASKIIEILEEEFTPKDNWISVDDRLPELSDYSNSESTCICADFLVFNGIEISMESYLEGRGFREICEVTHWKNLPSPPKTK